MLGSGQVELAFIGGLGPTELIVIFLIVLLVFGAKRIPEIAQGLGKGIMEFKKAAREITNDFDSSTTESKTYVKNELKGQDTVSKPQEPSSQPKKSESEQV